LVYYLLVLFRYAGKCSEMELMSKRTREGRPAQSDSNVGEPTPPLLSEKLIAELQGAVNAAQRKRMAHAIDPREAVLNGQPVAREALRAHD
jgi:hypothetical protein